MKNTLAYDGSATMIYRFNPSRSLKRLYSVKCFSRFQLNAFLRRHDTQHNDIRHNGTQHKDTQHNYNQQKDAQHNYIQQNDTQHKNSHHNDIQQNDTQHNGA
jgi:hypothetical protein